MSWSFVIVFSNLILMESTLLSTAPRLIEYPDDLSCCNAMNIEGRQLLYLCSLGMEGKTSFVVVLGFYLGQKVDIVKKDLIEPVADELKQRAVKAIISSLPVEYTDTHILFI